MLQAPNVRYLQSAAEYLSEHLPPRSVDLIAMAETLHWCGAGHRWGWEQLGKCLGRAAAQRRKERQRQEQRRQRAVRFCTAWYARPVAPALEREPARPPYLNAFPRTLPPAGWTTLPFTRRLAKF